MPHFHIFSTKMMSLNIWSTDEHPKYQGDFRMTAFSRILAVYLLTLLIMELDICLKFWQVLRGMWSMLTLGELTPAGVTTASLAPLALW